MTGIPKKYNTTNSPSPTVHTLYQKPAFHIPKASPNSSGTIIAFDITGNKAAIGIFLMNIIGIIASAVARVPNSISYQPRLDVVLAIKQPKIRLKAYLGFNTTSNTKISLILNWIGP